MNKDKIINWLLIHLRIIDYLNKTNIKKIVETKPTKENFLKIFPKSIREYLNLRWEKFPEATKEKHLKCVKFK